MKRIFCLLGIVALGGCVSVRQVSAPTDAVTSLQGQPLTVITHEKSDFAAMTYGRAMLGMIGAAAMIGEGNDIIKNNAVPDPADKIASVLTPFVTDRLKTKGTTVIKNVRSGDDDEAVLSAKAGGKGVILEVQTINWSFIYFPFDWDHYRIMMVARARLINAATVQRIAQGSCQYKSDEDHPPTYDELVANNAAVLKAKLDVAADNCVQTIEKGLF